MKFSLKTFGYDDCITHDLIITRLKSLKSLLTKQMPKYLQYDLYQGMTGTNPIWVFSIKYTGCLPIYLWWRLLGKRSNWLYFIYLH